MKTTIFLLNLATGVRFILFHLVGFTVRIIRKAKAVKNLFLGNFELALHYIKRK